jgi:hypothetical protein
MEPGPGQANLGSFTDKFTRFERGVKRGDERNGFFNGDMASSAFWRRKKNSLHEEKSLQKTPFSQYITAAQQASRESI